MLSLQELVVLGEKLGLKEEALQAFIREQQELTIQECAKEREEKERDRALQQAKLVADQELQRIQIEADKEFQQSKLKAEQAKLNADLKLQKARMEADQFKINADLELGKLKIKLAAKKVEATKKDDTGKDEDEEVDHSSVHSVSHATKKIRGPKMKAFDERDDIDSHLHRFERYAELQGWKKTAWAIYLAALLKGKALDVYARLPADQAQDKRSCFTCGKVGHVAKNCFKM